MINGGYLIPANTKKGQLIAGYFTPSDLILVGTGVSITIVLLIILGVNQTGRALLALAPGLVTAFLVMPIANYRNVRTFLKSMIDYYFNTQKEYKWKGWCTYEQGKK